MFLGFGPAMLVCGGDPLANVLTDVKLRIPSEARNVVLVGVGLVAVTSSPSCVLSWTGMLY